MILINCPYCGKRDQSEFSNGGQAHVVRPKDPQSISDKEWGEYVFFRSNPKGIFFERWVHSHGCRKWFNAVRNTSTDKIIKIYKLDEKPPLLNDFEANIKTPSGEPEVGSGNFTIKKWVHKIILDANM